MAAIGAELAGRAGLPGSLCARLPVRPAPCAPGSLCARLPGRRARGTYDAVGAQVIVVT
jgi:hypothetical protein